MLRQPLQINDLNTALRQTGQNIGLGGAGVAIEQDQAMGQGRIVQGGTDQPPIGHISTLNRIRPPADLLQDRGKRPRPLPAPPAIDEGSPCAIVLRQRSFDMGRHIAGDHDRTDLAGVKGADLLVDRTNRRPFIVG